MAKDDNLWARRPVQVVIHGARATFFGMAGFAGGRLLGLGIQQHELAWDPVVAAPTKALLAGGLFLAVVLPAGLAGFFSARSNRDASAFATLAWLPAVVWFAFVFFQYRASDRLYFWNLFVGDGFCGDFACIPQFYATAPLLAGVAYSVASVIARSSRH